MSDYGTCRYNGWYWECDFYQWHEQERACKLARKATKFERCMYLCSSKRCDNWQAHGPVDDRLQDIPSQ